MGLQEIRFSHQLLLPVRSWPKIYVVETICCDLRRLSKKPPRMLCLIYVAPSATFRYLIAAPYCSKACLRLPELETGQMSNSIRRLRHWRNAFKRVSLEAPPALLHTLIVSESRVHASTANESRESARCGHSGCLVLLGACQVY